MKILFVCLGNICRSPIADGIMRQLCKAANLDWEIDSAGTESYHIGEKPHIESQRVCQENGIDISHLHARKFIHSDCAQFDRIYAMSTDVLAEMKLIAGKYWEKDKIQLFLDVEPETKGQSVKDPWYGPPSGYDEVYQVIEKGCQAILKNYHTNDSF
jgi:protein-tyrosine phosphatase